MRFRYVRSLFSPLAASLLALALFAWIDGNNIHELWLHPLHSWQSITDIEYKEQLYCQAVLFMAVLALLAWLETRHALRTWLRYTLMAGVMLGAITAAATNVMTSVDFYYYIAYGRELLYLHSNPYTTHLDALLNDPIIHKVPGVWLHVYCNYGPSTVMLSALINWLAPEDPYALLVAFKTVWLEGFVIMAWLSYRLCRQAPRLQYTRWIALCGNPVIWALALRDAHLELLVIAFITAAWWALHNRKWLSSGLYMAIACSIKLIVLPLMPLFMLYIFARENEPFIKAAGIYALVFLLYTVPLYVFFKGGDIYTLYDFAKVYATCPQIILSNVRSILGGALFYAHPAPFDVSSPWVMLALLLVVALTVFGLTLRHILARRPPPLAGPAACLMLGVLLTAHYHWPWYILWSAPFLPLAPATAGGVLFASAFLTYYGIQDNGCQTATVASVFMLAAALVGAARALLRPNASRAAFE